jgi:hypothetical protein
MYNVVSTCCFSTYVVFRVEFVLLIVLPKMFMQLLCYFSKVNVNLWQILLKYIKVFSILEHCLQPCHRQWQQHAVKHSGSHQEPLSKTE